MKRLTYFIIRSFVGPFLITFFIAMFFLVMQFLWKYVDDLMGKGLEITVILELLFYVSATLIPLALPLAVLFSSIMTFGNLAEKNELTALKSSGLSLFRIMRPMFIFILFLSSAAFYFTNYILPIANLKWRTIIYNIQTKKPTFGINEGIFYNDIDGYSIKVEEKNDNTGELTDVLIYQMDKRRQEKIIKAEYGQMLKSENDRFLLLKLMNGSMYQEVGAKMLGKAGNPFQKTFFEEGIIKFDLGGFAMKEESEDLFKREYEMMNFRQLGYALDSLETDYDTMKIEFEQNLNRQLLVTNPDFAAPRMQDSILLNTTPELIVDTVIKLADLKVMEYTTALTGAQSNIRSTKDFTYTQTIIRNGRLSSFQDYKSAWHKKFTLSFAIVILFFVGAPLGAIIKKGGLGAPLVFATLFFLLYYILMISGENMVESGLLEVWKGMWMSSLILTPVSIFLTYKAANDSALFDWDIYKKYFRRLIGKKT